MAVYYKIYGMTAGEEDITDHRPVYILGAGFSKAICDEMPLLNALGQQALNLLPKASRESISFREGESFEQWLSMRTQDMPFLPDHENMRRRAEAMEMIDAIGSVLDDDVVKSCKQECPLWLRQLVNLWAYERAIIITFNYDTLLEMAINTERPALLWSIGARAKQIVSDEVVYPRPEAASMTRWIDFSENLPCRNSMQIIKPHGSLNWYSYGNDGEVILKRIREEREYDETVSQNKLDARENEKLAVTGMDRFLIPPSSNKASFYGNGFDRLLWRSAYDALEQAESLTIMGYSMPETDYVVNELIRNACVPNKCSLHVVDAFMDEQKRERFNRLVKWQEISETTGTNCLSRYAEEHTQTEARLTANELQAKLNDVDNKACIYVAGDMKRNQSNTGELSLLEKTNDGKLVFGCRDRTVSDFRKDKVPASTWPDTVVCTITDLERCLAEHPEYLEISRHNGSGKSLIVGGFFTSSPVGNGPLILGSVPKE